MNKNKAPVVNKVEKVAKKSVFKPNVSLSSYFRL